MRMQLHQHILLSYTQPTRGENIVRYNYALILKVVFEKCTRMSETEIFRNEYRFF